MFKPSRESNRSSNHTLRSMHTKGETRRVSWLIVLGFLAALVILSGCSSDSATTPIDAPVKATASLDSAVAGDASGEGSEFDSANAEISSWSQSKDKSKYSKRPKKRDSANSGSQSQSASNPAPKVIKAVVVKHTDGDTAHFELADGSREKVRFIGIDTPENTTQKEQYGQEASDYTAHKIAIGDTVYLEIDSTKRDKYERLLAYVWLRKPGNSSESEIRKKMLNAQIVLAGLAEPMTIAPNVKYANYLKQFTSEAQNQNKGMWAN